MTKLLTLAIFDLDNTLLKGDSDHAWGEFLIEQGLVNKEVHKKANDQFYQDYLDGDLDINAYLEFALGPIANKTPEELEPLKNKFVATKIQNLILPKAEALLERHRQAGDYLLIITATNQFVTQPIADLLGVDELIACKTEMVDGRYTGKPTGIPSYHSGKVTRLQSWLAQQESKGNKVNLACTPFYSDSHNDIPLLEIVGNPIAVDPDDKLREYAKKRQWQCISLR